MNQNTDATGGTGATYRVIPIENMDPNASLRISNSGTIDVYVDLMVLKNAINNLYNNTGNTAESERKLRIEVFDVTQRVYTSDLITEEQRNDYLLINNIFNRMLNTTPLEIKTLMALYVDNIRLRERDILSAMFLLKGSIHIASAIISQTNLLSNEPNDQTQATYTHDIAEHNHEYTEERS
jgi:hypothetical protein